MGQFESPRQRVCSEVCSMVCKGRSCGKEEGNVDAQKAWDGTAESFPMRHPMLQLPDPTKSNRVQGVGA